MSEEEVYDYGLYVLRTQLSTVQGLDHAHALRRPRAASDGRSSIPQLLQAKGISPKDVADAINAYNLAFPTGVARIDTHEYPVTLNNTPLTPDSFNDIPDQGRRRRDDLHARRGPGPRRQHLADHGRPPQRQPRGSGHAPQERQRLDAGHRQPGQGDAAADPGGGPAGSARSTCCSTSRCSSRRRSKGVVTESVIAGLLTAAMILVFLGSWRSTLIVAVSIPLAILSSIVMLYLLGHSLNVMTLGGLALAVGILVDDATVEIENIHRNLGMGKPLRQAILDGAMQIAGPTFVSTLTISIVFVSVVFLDGPPKYLFTPLALAVAFAMLASYLLSRTIVPTMVDYLLPAELAHMAHGARPRVVRPVACRRSSAASSKLRDAYASAAELESAASPRLCSALFGGIVASGLSVLPLGRARLLSRRSTRGSSACTCARRPARASNRPSATSATSKTPSARSFRPRKSSWCSTTSACPTGPTHGVRRQRHHGHGRRRNPGGPGAPSLAIHARIHGRRCGASCRERFPAADVLFPAGRHREPDLELRPAGPDRHPGRRPESASRTTRWRPKIAEQHPADPRRCRTCICTR